jgi:mono/diheme cytochrome c family protein
MQEGPDRVDYQETRDVTEVHASIKREHSDPKADVTPIPVWLTALCGVVVCWAGAYLGVFHGDFNSTVYNEYDSSPAALFPIAKSRRRWKRWWQGVQSLTQQGKLVYGQCAAVSPAKRHGWPGIPPLQDRSGSSAARKRLIRILLKGCPRAHDGEGQAYNGVMPPWEGSLTDKKIAAVASYVRAEWGNAAPEIQSEGRSRSEDVRRSCRRLHRSQLLEIPEADAPCRRPKGQHPPQSPRWQRHRAAGQLPRPGLQRRPPADAGCRRSSCASASHRHAAPTLQLRAASPEILAEGKKNYMMICVACHQPDRKGLPGVFPPLDKTEYVPVTPQRFGAMILKGVAGDR